MDRKKFSINTEKKFEVKHQFQTYTDETLLSEVRPIEEGMIDPEQSGISLENLVEYPLLDAAKIFSEKSIKTYTSSANQKDVGGETYITLYYTSLSNNNKKIAESVGEVYEYLKEKYVKISIPVKENTTVGEVRQESKEIANMFEDQKI